jgi:non-ribosomal peptide synthetase-like protein
MVLLEQPYTTTGPAPAPPPARTLLDVFGATVLEHPRRPALETSDESLTYEELAARATEIAHRLARLGIGPGDKVGIRILSGTAELYIAILGVLHAGAAYVPVDADDPEARTEQVWEESAAVAVLGTGLDLAVRARPSGARRAVSVTDDAWVIFTSGSSGRPKGVAVSHRAAAAFVDAEARLFFVTPSDRVFAGLSVGFDASCEEMWLAWRNGATLVPAPRAIVRNGLELGPWLSKRRISVVSTVPTLAAMWDLDQLDDVRLVILGGEACPNELGWRLAAGREVWNTYGPTETTVVATAVPILPGEPVTIGHPLDGWEVAVLDADGSEVPDGVAGELVIGGVGLGRYLDEALDAEGFAPLFSRRWPRAYRSGDFVRQGPRGLEFIGRRDDQVKIGGRRIELKEVETELSSIPGVRQATVVVQQTPSGSPVLVAYVVSEIGTEAIREHLVRRLPGGIQPILVPLTELPTSNSGKVDRRALPWPPPEDHSVETGLTQTERWLAERWAAHLGIRPTSAGDDFFVLGGTSTAAAKLTSDIRHRFPAVAVADIYTYRSLSGLAGRLDGLTVTAPPDASTSPTPRVAYAPQLLGVVTLLALTAPTWIVAVFAYNDVTGQSGLPQLAWPWLLAIWVVLISPVGRVLLVAAARRGLLGNLKPGRCPRRSWTGVRVWFVDRLAQTLHVYQYGGSPWASTVARLLGMRVGERVHLGVIPSPAGLTSIGDGATLEADADVGSWWIDGADVVVDRVSIGDGARIGARTLLMPGASIGANADVEPGGVVNGDVPPDERWAGAPARFVGPAGQGWPENPPATPRRKRLWHMAYGAGHMTVSLLPLVAAVPGLVLIDVLRISPWGAVPTGTSLLAGAALLGVTFILTYALLVALLVRWLGRSIRPGWHGPGRTTWAVWLCGQLFTEARTALFPLYSSLCTRWWLRLMGLKVGRRSEVSTAVGLSPLVSLGATDFVADDVVFNTGRTRHGWVQLSAVDLGDEVFLGNGALINGGTSLGQGSLVGVQSTAPDAVPAHTSWFGAPPLEFPRVPEQHDPQRTVSPSGRLVVARALAEIIRIVLPTTASMVIAISVFDGLEVIGRHFGSWAIIVSAPAVLLMAGITAVVLTALAKWGLMGRYHAGDHPLWSWFVWRDEIVNTCQEVLAGVWLLDIALASPIMNLYLRFMGSQVGRDAWCDTMTITEFDMVRLGDGCAINRNTCIETHLFQDRIMSIGPTDVGASATVGPSSVVLPDTRLGDGSCVGGRSVVLRGEEIPAHSRWHGAPVVAM